MNKQPNATRLVAYLLVLALAFFLLSSLFDLSAGGLSYAQVVEAFETEQVTRFSLDADGSLTMALADQTQTVSAQVDPEQFHRDLDSLIREQSESGILIDYDFPPASESLDWGLILSCVLLGGMIVLIISNLAARRENGNPMGRFTQANARLGSQSNEPVTFADVAGAEEEKEELREVVDFLKDPERFTQLGARIPKGILLVGPPGTGKTLLARAVAGEAGVRFLSISGSDFVELYVGVGAGRVRDLFQQAKKMAPAIVFIDEIDAVGRRRGAGMGGGHDEREQTLNQLLVEMDGFGQNQGVIVMAATNRKDILDPALLRPGRFDRQIYVGAPDWRGREAVLRVHARKKPLAEDVDLEKLARATSGFTGADLENLLNEAALLAARNGQRVLTNGNLEDAMLKVLAGPEKRSRVVTDYDKRVTAIHEAGHAVVMYQLPTHDPVHQITIIPRGGAAGMTISLPRGDEMHVTRNELFERIVALLGGRVAEQLLLDDISTGASNDIQRATDLAHDMVTRYGFSQKLGTVSYGSDSEIFVGRDYEKSKAYSEKIAGDIDEEVKSIVDKAYSRCETLLCQKLETITRIADTLVERETMNSEEFEQIMQEA